MNSPRVPGSDKPIWEIRDEPGVSIGRVARRNGIDHHLLRRWWRLLSRGTLGEAGAERHCMVCNEPFEATRPDAKFCSSKCRQKAYRLQKASAPERSWGEPFR